MGDDLEDDFVPGGDEYLSSGEDEDNTTGLGGDPDVDGEGIVPDSRSDSPLVAGGKRKASDDEDGSDSEEDVTVNNGPKTGAGGKELTAEERKKEKKRRNKEKLKEKKKQRLNASSLTASAPGAASSSSANVLSALRVNQRLGLSKLSDLEWEDRELPESALLSTPTATSLTSLINSLPISLPQTPPKSNGSPHVLILASSGIRCADLVRELRPLLGPLVQEDVKGKGSKSGDGKDKRGKTKKAKVDGPGKPVNGEIAKLFAKHFKLSEHIAYLQHTPLSMAVGTPHRVAELISAGALKVPPYVLFDYTFRDSKARSLLDNIECRDSIWQNVLGPQLPLWEGLKKGEGEVGAVRLGVF